MNTNFRIHIKLYEFGSVYIVKSSLVSGRDTS